MKEGLIKDAYELIIKELQSVVTVGYIFMVGIGMLFNHRFYENFGVNIFEYGDVLDFLIAPFEDIIIVLFTIGSCIVVWIAFYMDKFWREKSPKWYSIMNFGIDKSSWFSIYRVTGFILVFLLYLNLAAMLYGDIKSAKVEDQANIEVRFSDNEVISGKLIGKTQGVLFLLQEDQVKAIPITAMVKEYDIR
ncbi:MAG: hypothetical protein Sapg2KO_33980 [Saprospiraceae bacterium]